MSFSPEFISTQKNNLLSKKAEIEQQLTELPVHEVVGRYDESATEEQLDELHGEFRFQLEHQLTLVNAALERIEAGTYGYTESGDMISEKRLEVIPWATTDAH